MLLLLIVDYYVLSTCHSSFVACQHSKPLHTRRWLVHTGDEQVSALTREGFDNLLETLLVQAEVLELRADKKVRGEY